MAQRRGKVVLARINNRKQRKACERKRIKGLLKKMEEITTLCGTEAAAVIYNPDDNKPTVWPSTAAAKETISKFLDTPEADRKANSHTAKSFMEERCRKKKEKAQRLIDEERNIQALITSIYEGETKIQDLDSETRQKLSDFADQKMEEIRKHIQRLKMEQQVPQSAQVLSPDVQMPPVSQATSGLNMNGLGAGRNLQSPTAAHGQLMDVGGITRGIMQQEALSQAQQMPSVASSLHALNINDVGGGGNFTFPAAAAHGQDLNLRGTNSLPVIPPIIQYDASGSNMSGDEYSHWSTIGFSTPATRALDPINFGAGRNLQSATAAHGRQLMDELDPSTGSRLNMTGGIHGQESLSQAQQMPSVASSLSALNINDLAGGGNFTFPAAAAHGQDLNLREGSVPDITIYDYGWDPDEFLGPPTYPLNQRNFTDVRSDGE